MTALFQAVATLAALLLVWAAPASAAGDDSPAVDPAAGQPPAVTVSLRGNRFHPARITVVAGTSVTWSNDEEDAGVEHNVISRDYRWASSNFLPGETYERTFTTPGTYRYFCDLHGGMVGQVTVEG